MTYLSFALSFAIGASKPPAFVSSRYRMHRTPFNMPRVLERMPCPSCGELVAPKTALRHMRDWMGMCLPGQRATARRAAALRARLERTHRQAPAERSRNTGHTHSLPRRDRQASTPPPDGFPLLRRRAGSSPTPPPRSPSPSDTNQQCSSPAPGRTDFELYMRDRAWHDDYEFDTPGAGPSREEDPYAELRRLANEDIERGEPLATLADGADWIQGLSSQDLLGQEIDAELARCGGRSLDPADLATVRAFNYKVDTDISAGAFNKLPRAFPELDSLGSLYKTRRRVAELSGVGGVDIECCENSCIAYTGTFKRFEECPYCRVPRYEVDPNNPDKKRARCHFRYIPIIPRLRNFFLDPKMIDRMKYRTRRCRRQGVYSDIFDGSHYLDLLKKWVIVAGDKLQHKHFSEKRDIALGLSTDGFAPFDTNETSSWPIILFNYNLSPAIRFRLENIICVGVIPGPNQPKEINTFIEPLIEELEDLARGVPAFDSDKEEKFCLHAYLIVCFGDMPAVAKLMCMHGHTGKTHPLPHNYVPLSRPHAPANEVRDYNPIDLPLRTHNEFIRQASQVQDAPTTNQAEKLASQYGIHHIPPLARLSSIELPVSFPHDFMHAMFENVIPTLISLWTHKGRFADFGTGNEDYVLGQGLWADTGAACAASGDSTPAAFGCRVPDLSNTRRRITAEMRMLFATLLAPALLYQRFKNERYYRHFIDLVGLVNQCLALEITESGIDKVRTGFARWVRDYEKLYYQKTTSGLRACTLPVHSLLHIADDISLMGPVWCYWAFPMERFCGALSRTTISRRFPNESLNEIVAQVAQLAQLKHIYGLSDELNLEARHSNCATGTRYPTIDKIYDELVFVHPKRTSVLPDGHIRRRIANYLGIVLGEDSNHIYNRLAGRPFVLWGKMQETSDTGPGDTYRGHTLCRESKKGRDASYVQYFTYYDRWDRTSVREVDEQTTGYGRVEFFVVIDTDFLEEIYNRNRRALPGPYTRPYILAILSPIPRFKKVSVGGFVRFELNAGGNNDGLASAEIIDVNDIGCLVGRLQDQSGRWSIINRETIVGRLDVLESIVDRS
ncbi:Elongator complex protein 1 [Rhizoctonia solani]|uniref:Elongator complex protein 1 n=1 Tax=Rhizoctonia solani TaxID=456999 RepID=A0A0K6FXE8_9AGAM|nr:Elongator complex protein 1 [Rhizoctonia solani]